MVAVPHATILNCDMAAREYIQALQSRQMSRPRPELGRWDALVIPIERAYVKSDGNPEIVAQLIQSLGKQYPELEDLLRPEPEEPTLARVESVQEIGVPALPEFAQLPAQASQGACPPLDLYEKYSKKASPESWDEFHAVCGIWGFSAAAARRVYLELGPKRFYTNLYMVLAARTTLIAKTETAEVAKRMLQEAGLGHLLLGDRMSPQKFLSDMSGSFVPTAYMDWPADKQEKQRRKSMMPGQRAWHYDEFGKFVQNMVRKNSSSADFAEIFLRLDKCPDEYENSTISRGAEPIEKPYLTLLGTMTPSNIRDSAARGGEFWQDGFWARFSFICAPADWFKTETWGMEPLPIPYELKRELRDWNTRLGEPYCTIDPINGKNEEPTGRYQINREDLPQHACSLSTDAYEAYKNYRIALRGLIAGNQNQDLDGNYGRLPETAMRMAMIMASLSNNNRIELRHWARAQELAEVLRRNLHELYAQVNTPSDRETKGAEIENRILALLQKGPMTINLMRRDHLRKYSTKELKEILNAMARAGSVEPFKTTHGEKYRIKEETTEE